MSLPVEPLLLVVGSFSCKGRLNVHGQTFFSELLRNVSIGVGKRG